MKKYTLWLLFVFMMILPPAFAQRNFTQYVDPFIGTGGHGHTYPGATLPFGMVQLSPDTRLSGWDGCSGYHYSDTVIYGFSHTHLSGTGCSDYGDILFMPMSGTYSFDNKIYSSPFKHKNEKASAGYYSVLLNDGNILAELTTTIRVGFHRYTFSNSNNPYIILDLVHRDKVIASSLKISGNNRIEGMRRSKAWADDQHIYFVAEFSEPFSEFGIAEFDSLKKGLTFSDSKNIKAFFRFNAGSGKVIMLKVGISTVSIEGARKNLEAELKDWDFNLCCRQAEDCWNKELSKIEADGQPDQLKVFYTALYHTMVVPNVNMDVDGSYRGRDNEIHKATGFTYYSVFSLWDTYRAAHPLYTIIDRKRSLDFIKTFLAEYEQGGKLPVWEFASNETECMIGYHAVPVIADAAIKGINGFDTKLALEAMKTSANWKHYGLPAYMEHGYIDVEDESESVSRTLEYAYDDWCIAEMAKLLNDDKIYTEYIQRAQYYKNVFDHQSGFMRPRKNGNWISPFDPKEVNNNYTEANAWQYTFYVPQDISGLISRMGGQQAFADKLDSLFTTGSETTGREQADISGLIGQYAHGNEPSHHMAYLYNFAGQPQKTQFYVHKILDEFYKTLPDGLIGNEDCGQMSAWYVLSAMGFYQVTPATTSFIIGSPSFKEVKIHLENSKVFTIRTSKAAKNSFYIASAKLDGSAYSNSFIDYQKIMDGSTLEFEMSPKAGLLFGSKTENIPATAISTNLITETPLIVSNGKSFYDKMEVKILSSNPLNDIYYTTDGSFPVPAKTGVNHSQGSVSFFVDTNIVVKTIAVSREGVESKVVHARYFKTHKNRKIKILSRYSRQYTAGGDEALIDGIRGDNNWRKGEWQGYQGKDFIAVLDLGKVNQVRLISAGFLEDSMAWIYLPGEILYETSTDSINWKKFPYNMELIRNTGEGEPYSRDFSITESNSFPARYIRITAKNHGKLPPTHPGAGGDSWIFVDEVMVE